MKIPERCFSDKLRIVFNVKSILRIIKIVQKSGQYNAQGPARPPQFFILRVEPRRACKIAIFVYFLIFRRKFKRGSVLEMYL